MTLNDILTMLKANLEIMNTIKDAYLNNLITVAITEIQREGITFKTELDAENHETYAVDDANLIVMYGAYLYRNRVNDSEAGYKTALASTGMPRMLRYALNNKLLSQKMGESES